MKFGIRHLMLLLFVVALLFGIRDRILVERRLFRAEAQYALAWERIQILEDTLDDASPKWRDEIEVPFKYDNLPEPVIYADGSRLASGQ